MPAVSRKQQQLMGIVHAIQTGKMKPSKASATARQMAKNMKPKDVKDFASTSHKGLPDKVSDALIKKVDEIIFRILNKQLNEYVYDPITDSISNIISGYSNALILYLDKNSNELKPQLNHIAKKFSLELDIKGNTAIFSTGEGPVQSLIKLKKELNLV